MIAGTFCPRGTYEANGQNLALSAESTLYSIFGTIYGGNGRTDFALPDLQGRRPVHNGTGPGLSPIQIGQSSGSIEQTVRLNNMPSHTHEAGIGAHTHTIPGHTHETKVQPSTGGPNANDPQGNAFATFSGGSIYTDGALSGDSFAAGMISIDESSYNLDSHSVPGARTTHEGVEDASIPVEAPGLAIRFCLVWDGTYPVRE